MTPNKQSFAQKKLEEAKPSLVSPVVAGLCSIVLPGLGQILARSFRRGLLLMASFGSMLGLFYWRIGLAAKYDEGFWNILNKAIKLQPFIGFVLVSMVILYIWIIVDAYIMAKRPTKQPTALFFLLIIVFFAFGWQIGQIDVVSFFTKAGNAGPALMRVLWPWQRAIYYPESISVGAAKIESPCTDELFPETVRIEGEPYLKVNPTCGTPTEQDGEPGTSLVLTGEGFAPGVIAEIWWRDPVGNEFRQRQSGEYVKVTPDDQGNFQTEIIFPYRLLPPGAKNQVQVWTIEARQIAALGDAEPSSELKLAIEKIIETIFIGMMATVFGIILALPVSFLAARNLMSGSPIALAIYYITRTILNIIRSIEPLIWAIIAVIVVGLGPFAGILALTIHSLASLAKLYSEAIESIDQGPIEAIQATGANWLQTIMYAVVPQVVPPFVSFTIYRWDINIRMSTIIGFVGGGGIGFLLAQWIRLLDYSAAGIAVWFIAITVAILDYVSAEIRNRFV
jgi:phosphonate transport system permease protein